MAQFLEEMKTQFREAVAAGVDYVETHPGVAFSFRLSEVRESVPAYIFSFAAANQPARDVLAAMRQILPHQPGSAGESWRQAFNTFVDHARERNFVTEAPEKMLLTIQSPTTVPVLRPLVFRGQP